MTEKSDDRRGGEEREVLARDRQEAPPRPGQVDVFAGPEPDGIPMTGEEDPLSEVDAEGFAEVVAEFAASEKRKDH